MTLPGPRAGPAAAGLATPTTRPYNDGLEALYEAKNQGRGLPGNPRFPEWGLPMNLRRFVTTIAAIVMMAASTPAEGASGPRGGTRNRRLRPIHWWIGNLETRANAATAHLVASWSYWPLNGVFDAAKEKRRMRLLVGGATSMDAVLQQIQVRYDQGFRTLATNHENWTTKTTAAQAAAFVKAIESRPGLTVLQWNHHMTWVDEARPILAKATRLGLMEMTYPTAEGKKTYTDMCKWIMSFMRKYKRGKEPGIGLSVYTAHDSATPIGWDLMKTQIDAAKAVGAAMGSPSHPIGIYISNAQPTEFTVDDVNNYIVYGTRTPDIPSGK